MEGMEPEKRQHFMQQQQIVIAQMQEQVQALSEFSAAFDMHLAKPVVL